VDHSWEGGVRKGFWVLGLVGSWGFCWSSRINRFLGSLVFGASVRFPYDGPLKTAPSPTQDAGFTPSLTKTHNQRKTQYAHLLKVPFQSPPRVLCSASFAIASVRNAVPSSWDVLLEVPAGSSEYLDPICIRGGVLL